jgi:hypothetical protein
MKLFCGISGGTPPGGAIILGKFDGIVLAVGLGVGIVEASTMMLVPTIREVALSVAVGLREKIGGAVLVGVGVTGMGILADSVLVDVGVSDVGGGVDFAEDDGTTEPVLNTDVGASLSVALPELEGVKVAAALLGEAVEVADEGSSEAGTLSELPEEVGTTDADVPTEPVPEGVMPELIVPEGKTLPENVAEGVTLAVSEGVGTTLSEAGTPDEDTTSEVGVGTAPDGKRPEEGSTPDEGRIPEEIGRPEEGNRPEDGRTPEEGSAPEDDNTPDDGRIPEDSRLEGKMVGIMTGPVPVGRAESKPDRMLDKALGTADAGRSETADDKSEESAGGRRPDALADGTGVSAVDARPVPVGRTPGSSDTTDERRPGISSIPELVAAVSEVGMAPELRRVGVAVRAADSPVPKAVVIPITMPDDGKSGDPLEPVAATLVGRTTLSGIPPVEPTWEVAVGASEARSEDKRPPTRPPDDVGCTIVSGTPPVEPTSEVAAGGRIDESRPPTKPPDEVGCTIVSGMPPVEPTSEVGTGARTDERRPPTRPPEEVGCTIVSGMPPVEPISGVGVGASSDERRPPTRPPEEVGWTIVSGIPPVDPGTMKGPRKLDASGELGAAEEAGDAVGVTIVSGMPPVEPTACSGD